MRQFTGIIGLIGAFSWALWGQSPSTPRFTAASIKQNNAVQSGIGNRFGPELFSFTNVPLRILIEQAYGLKDYQILSAPNWVNSEKWDITARTDGPTTFAQKFEMAKTLLIERFQMKFHLETRELPVYMLVVVKDGPKFQNPKDDNQPMSLRIGTGLIAAQKYDVSSLAGILSGQLNIPVLDKAGLTGIYDFTIQWAPAPNEGDFAYRGDSNDPAPPDSTGPSIFTALQEQLGLKLEKSKGPVEVMVMDNIERPTGN